MANIIEEILRAAENDEPLEEAAERIARKVMEDGRRDLDTDVTISYHHKKGTGGAEIEVYGRGKGIIEGMCNLLGEAVFRMVNGNKEAAKKILGDINKGAQIYINERGGYRRCAGLC